MMSRLKAKKNNGIILPSHRPGEEGTGAVFICTVCGRKFTRTMKGQEQCSAACMEKAKSGHSEQE